MYKCNNCGAIFDEYATHREYHGEVDCSEYWSCCPICGDSDIDIYDDAETETEAEDTEKKPRRHMKFEDVCSMRQAIDKLLKEYGLEIRSMIVRGGGRFFGEIEIQEIKESTHEINN